MIITKAIAHKLDFGLMNETQRNVMPNLRPDYASLKAEVDRTQTKITSLTL